MEIGFAAAFMAGLITFLAPCTLPLVPAFLGFISGGSTKRTALLKNALGFVIGFSLVFVVFGAVAGALGSLLVVIRPWLIRIGGIVIIFFGLGMLGLFKLPFFEGASGFKLKGVSEEGGSLKKSLVVGASFGFGWTPCIGPILGTILTLAATEGGVLGGASLLAVFSIGLAIPFLLLAFGYSSIAPRLERANPKILMGVTKVGAVLFILLGIILFTDSFYLVNQYGVELLDDLYFNTISRWL